jgi:polysaccharide export outer membrane protein
MEILGMGSMNELARCLSIMALTSATLLAQEGGVALDRDRLPEDPLPAGAPKQASATNLSQYLLGPLDQISLWSGESEELAGRTYTIDNGGAINVPLVGRVNAAGLTTEQLEAELSKKLAAFLRRPQVSVAIVEFGSQPVSVIGAVGSPGVHQLRGRRNLVEVLSVAGGLREHAGHAIKITRRIEYGRIPLDTAVDDPSGRHSIAEVSLRRITEAKNPEENIEIRPHDIISVPTAEMVYVVGEVSRAGGFVLNEQKSISVLQALSLAGGLTQFASAGKARILRGPEGSRREIAVDLKKVLGGKSNDVHLVAKDILFIPDSRSKKIAIRVTETALQTVSGVLIWSAAR